MQAEMKEKITLELLNDFHINDDDIAVPDEVEYEKDDEEAAIPDITRDFDDSDDDSVNSDDELSSDLADD